MVNRILFFLFLVQLKSYYDHLKTFFQLATGVIFDGEHFWTAKLHFEKETCIDHSCCKIHILNVTIARTS